MPTRGAIGMIPGNESRGFAPAPPGGGGSVHPHIHGFPPGAHGQSVSPGAAGDIGQGKSPALIAVRKALRAAPCSRKQSRCRRVSRVLDRRRGAAQAAQPHGDPTGPCARAWQSCRVQGVQAYIQHTRGLRRIHQKRYAVLLTNGAQTAYGLNHARHVAGMAKDYQGCPGPDGTLKRVRLQDAHGVGREDTQGNLPRGGKWYKGRMTALCSPWEQITSSP